MYRLMKYQRIATIAMFLSILSMAAAGDADAADGTEVASVVVNATLIIVFVRWIWGMFR